jgi:hypothetical protein
MTEGLELHLLYIRRNHENFKKNHRFFGIMILVGDEEEHPIQASAVVAGNATVTVS